MVKKINQAGFEAEAMKGLAVVDFSAVWCGPCQMLAPILEEISEELAGKANFYQVDIDEDMKLALRYGITSVPSVLVFEDGIKKDMLIGFRPKDEFKADIEKYIK